VLTAEFAKEELLHQRDVPCLFVDSEHVAVWFLVDYIAVSINAQELHFALAFDTIELDVYVLLLIRISLLIV